MNKILVLAGIAIAAVAVWFLLSRDKPPAPSADATTGSATVGSGASTMTTSAPSPAPSTPVAKVGRVPPEERKRLAEQIAHARARRAGPSTTSSSSSTPPPQLAESDTKIVRTTLSDAMHDILDHLGDCYDKAGDKLPAQIKVVGKMTLTGDPDVGTIIDTDELADETGRPLEPGFDLCLRDAFVSLQVPPLSEGGEVKVTYPFVFSR